MSKKASTAMRNSAPKRRAADIRVRTVEAEEFRLVDSGGKVRAVLEMTRTGPSLAMMHEDGTIAFEIILAKDGPGLRLADESGNTRAFLGAKRGAARLGMADADGSQRLFLGVSSAGKATLSLYDENQQQIWTTAPGSRR